MTSSDVRRASVAQAAPTAFRPLIDAPARARVPTFSSPPL
ncbi:hypothetical protein H4W31_005239 [Plantactinospora soyae]|uniref:Uncharacterized protein n=1 Tax=Plantactinospora soyae TaxID=1544732 RepID=A0A927R9A9_9ACTN|nr:hypothetical protein [Plantactinospora soyae]